MKYFEGLCVILLLCGIVLSKPSSRNQSKDHKKRHEILDTNELDDFQERKEVTHDTYLQLKRLRESLDKQNHRRRKVDPCLYKRCGPGEECAVTSDVGQCICKRHCKPHNKPVCGSDGEYYNNHCEMYRHACLSNNPQIYDVRHKDCFYKASPCNRAEMSKFQQTLMDYYRNMVVESDLEQNDSDDKLVRTKRRNHANKHERKHEKKSNSSADLFEQEYDNNAIPVTLMENDEFLQGKKEKSVAEDVVNDSEYLDIEPEEAEEDELFPEDEMLTSDFTGELVKFMFNFFDLDEDGLIGSEEITQIIEIQQLDNVLPGTCTLHHVLYYGDSNVDKTIDLAEIFQLFNVTVLRLARDQRVVETSGAINNPLKLVCGIEGDKEPVWKRYNHVLDESNDYRILGNVLHITDVTMKKAGNFTCSAHTRPELVQTISVNVCIPPRVEIFPRIQHVHIGSSATIVCMVKGIPQPSITWLRNGEPMTSSSDRYILIGNKTELHFNDAQAQDDAVYTCSAQNVAGVNENSATLRVEHVITKTDKSPVHSYTVFHSDGISFVNPDSCEVLRNIDADEAVSGLLRQNHLCMGNEDGRRHCNWSSSVTTMSGLIYAAQPDEDRIVVTNTINRRTLEVITTDVMPVKLVYIPSSDQIFVLCWVDATREQTTLQVIERASTKGVHFAEHVRPILESGKQEYDFTIYDIFVPTEDELNPIAQQAYVMHNNEQMIYIMDLYTLSYVDYIDLVAYQCVPTSLKYQPIGGLLRVICNHEINKHFLTISVETNEVIEFVEDAHLEQEFFSDDFHYLVRLYPELEKVTIHNISSSGEIHEIMIIRTNFKVADVSFVLKQYDPTSTVVYMISSGQGDLMYVDLTKKKVELIDDHKVIVADESSWGKTTRSLTPSGWYGRFLMTSGHNGVEVISLNGNQILCRLDDIMHASAIEWNPTHE